MSEQGCNLSESVTSGLTSSFDPLLNCLLILAKLQNRATSKQAVTAGLPLVAGKLTPTLLVRAAKRIGFDAKLVKIKLRDIGAHQLPVVLFLKNGQACVMSKFNEDDATVQLIGSETENSYKEIALAELDKEYEGFVCLIVPQYNFDLETVKIAAADSKEQHWFWSVMRRAVPTYSEILVASLLLNLFALASPLFVMNVYDRVVPNGATATLWVLTFGVLLVFSFDFIMRNLRAVFIDAVGKKIDTQISRNTFEQLMNLQMETRPASVGVLSNAVHLFEFFREFITSASVSLLIDIPFALIFVVVIALLGGVIVFVPLVFIPLILVASFMMQSSFSELVTKSQQYTAEKQQILFESLSGIEAVKSMRAEGLMQRRWETIVGALAKLSVKMRAVANIGVNASVFLQQLSVVFVVVVGVYKITDGTITLGALIACVILVGRTLAPVAQLANLLTKYKQARASLATLDMIMHLPVERAASQRFLHMETIRGNLEFKNVTFNYPKQKTPVISDVSFKINAGERVGIIGRTGSGKSTLERLMLKLYNATSGNILVDGIEIQQLDPAELRHYIGYLPQEAALFHGTIRDNIVMGAPYVDDAAVMRAAKLSGVDIFVQQSPEGFSTVIFERGQNLSGGQRQSIALARALLFDPPILIFDEPCNSVDDITLFHFLHNLKEHVKNKTLILITHKAALLELVDRLLVVDGGRIVADGAKKDVIAKLGSANRVKKQKTSPQAKRRVQEQVKVNEKGEDAETIK